MRQLELVMKSLLADPIVRPMCCCYGVSFEGCPYMNASLWENFERIVLPNTMLLV